MEPVTSIDPQRTQQARLREERPSPVRRTLGRPDAQADLVLRHQQGVSSLLAHRADLRGVHAFADILEESVRWSA
jgi:hypothetical protein